MIVRLQANIAGKQYLIFQQSLDDPSLPKVLFCELHLELIIIGQSVCQPPHKH
jgi:hypothetical protein